MSKIDDLLDKAARFLMKRFGIEDSEPRRHPGKAYHARTEVTKKKGPWTNPHLVSWLKYMDHLFDLMLDGHGRSPAAMQTRDRLQFHWKFMSPKEQFEAMEAYQTASVAFQQRQAERKLHRQAQEMGKQRFRDLQEELDHFMAPKGN